MMLKLQEVLISQKDYLFTWKKSTGEYLFPRKKYSRSTFFRGVLIDGYTGYDYNGFVATQALGYLKFD